ncbi:MAG: threonine aldolase, partial [Anaerolineae bacterium]|nr:threonine aldolase [Anaerolineae bacterium]
GGMRQCGVIAAAGVVALDEMIDRLADDHTHARRLAEGIAQVPGVVVDLETVQTDIVYFDVVSAQISAVQLINALAERDILVLPVGPGRIRAVTHYGIEAADIDETVLAIREIMERVM